MNALITTSKAAVGNPQNAPPSLLPPYIVPPLRSVAFTRPWWSYDNVVCVRVLDRQDVQSGKRLVRNEAGAI